VRDREGNYLLKGDKHFHRTGNQIVIRRNHLRLICLHKRFAMVELLADKMLIYEICHHFFAFDVNGRRSLRLAG